MHAPSSASRHHALCAVGDARRIVGLRESGCEDWIPIDLEDSAKRGGLSNGAMLEGE